MQTCTFNIIFAIFILFCDFAFSDQCKPTTFNIQCCTQIKFKQLDTIPTEVPADANPSPEVQKQLVNEAWDLYSPVFQNQSHF